MNEVSVAEVKVREAKVSNPVLMLTEEDPWGAPSGGQTTFAKHLIIAFGSRVAVSSHCNDESMPIGQWLLRNYNDQPIWFLNRGPFLKRNDKKPLIPARITTYFNARRFLPKIRQREFSGLYVDSPEMLFAASAWQWASICYSLAGVSNPVAHSRYPWARFMGSYFEKQHITVLNRLKPDVMIAAADSEAIAEFHHRTGHAIDAKRFHQFPTRVDTQLFFPIDIARVRKELGLGLKLKIFVATGRLNWVKGWDILLESMVHVKKQWPDAILLFVGDGEDHAKLEIRAKELGVMENIRITGFLPQNEVVRYMNAADVCLVGSYREGWSIAMCEIIACGKAVVSTNVSGANDMVLEGRNGYIVRDRDSAKYAEAIGKALNLDNASKYSLELSEKYAVKNLAHDLGSLWSVLRPE